MSETDETIDSKETPKKTPAKKKRAKKLYALVGGKPDKIPMQWLDRIANEYGFDKIEHMPRFAAFRCYKDNRCIEWINYKELAKENGQLRVEFYYKSEGHYTKIGKRLFKSMR